VDKPVWSQELAGLTEKMDYNNFKSEAARHQGRKEAPYERALHEVWSVMYWPERKKRGYFFRLPIVL
jgi:hypothetical protein